MQTTSVERRVTMLQRGDLQIELISEGAGPLILMLPSARRGSEDFDEVAEGLASAGFRVLRPQPRGIGRSSQGPLEGVSLHDFADDVAFVIENEKAGPAILFGHAFGHYVARMTAVDHPGLVRGVVLAASASKSVREEISVIFRRAIDKTLPDEERVSAIGQVFFAPGHDAWIWRDGWSEAAGDAQRVAIANTRREEWWLAGAASILDLQAEFDPFRPPEKRYENQEDLGAHRVSIAVVPNASHALMPEQPQAVIEAVVAWARQL